MNRRLPHRRRQIATGMGLAAACLGVAYAGGLLTPGDWRIPTQSNTLFPAMMLIGASVSGLLIAAGVAGREPERVPVGGIRRALGALVLATVYAIALPRAGLTISTVIFCLTLPLVLNYRNLVWIGVFVVTIVVATWFVFIYLMNVPLSL